MDNAVQSVQKTETPFQQNTQRLLKYLSGEIASIQKDLSKVPPETKESRLLMKEFRLRKSIYKSTRRLLKNTEGMPKIWSQVESVMGPDFLCYIALEINGICEGFYYRPEISQTDSDRLLTTVCSKFERLAKYSMPDTDLGCAISGMLIYPRVDRTLRERYVIQGYPVTVCTVDLDQDWKEIRAEIFDLMDLNKLAP